MKNPYSPPKSDTSQLGVRQFRCLLGWIKLSPLYNLALIASITLVTFPAQPAISKNPRFWTTSCGIVLLANFCYAIFTVIDYALTTRSSYSTFVRWILIAMSCVLSFGLAIAAVAAEFYPGL